MSSSIISQLQLAQQNLQNILLQKQQFQTQEAEIESALNELKSTPKAYKIVGKIMLAASKEELTKELSDKKEMFTLRLSAFTKQEERLKKNIEELQKEAVKELEKKKS